MHAETPQTEEGAVDVLSAFVAGIRYEDLPSPVALHARYVWLDTLGVILAGSAEGYVTQLASQVARDDGSARIIGGGCPHADASSAALVNGTAGTVLELDEGHRPTGHPAIYVIPALLAAAEREASSGRELIASLVAGYEVGARLAAATAWRSDVHVHGAVGPAAAAAAVSHLSGGDERLIGKSIRVGVCLGIAAPFRAAFEGAYVRNTYAGIAGVLGLISHELVRAGIAAYVEAATDVFGRILGTAFATDRLVVRTGEDFMIRTNYFKRHAACRYIHSTLDALALAVGARRLTPTEIDHIRVVCDTNAARCNRPDPPNELAAKFSLPFAVATRIVNGRSDAVAFRDEMTADLDVRRVAARVSVVATGATVTQEGWSAYPASVEVWLTSGERLTGQVLRPVGDQPVPIPYEDVEQKFVDLTMPVLKPGGGRKLMDVVLHLADITVEELVATIRDVGADGLQMSTTQGGGT